MKTLETLKIEATLHKQRDRIWTIVPTRKHNVVKPIGV